MKELFESRSICHYLLKFDHCHQLLGHLNLTTIRAQATKHSLRIQLTLPHNWRMNLAYSHNWRIDLMLHHSLRINSKRDKS